MSLLFIYRSCRKDNTSLALWVKVVPHGVCGIGPASAHTLAEAGQHFEPPGCEVMLMTSQTGILMLACPQETASSLQRGTGGPVSLNLELTTQQSQDVILPPASPLLSSKGTQVSREKCRT